MLLTFENLSLKLVEIKLDFTKKYKPNYMTGSYKEGRAKETDSYLGVSLLSEKKNKNMSTVYNSRK